MLASMVPTVLMIGLGIVLVATGRGAGAIIIGVLVLAFCTASLTGYILGTIFVSRGAQVARFQHDYLSLVSHELRTPLTSILMFLDTLRDERLTNPEEKRQCMDLLDQEVRRLDQLLDRLLQLSRLQVRGHRFEREPVAVEAVVREALLFYEAATLNEKTPVDLQLESVEELLVAGDREALIQAVANLLINAWKYTPAEGRRIELIARPVERSVEIAVRDNGPGVSKEDQLTIFDEFSRSASARAGGRGGSGLGLAIVRTVVRAHRGKVELRSRPGHGSEFCIRLPRLRSA